MQGDEGGTILTTKAADSSILVAIFLALKNIEVESSIDPFATGH
jgi:hypothetical protein